MNYTSLSLCHNRSIAMLYPWASICSQSCEGPFPFPLSLPSPSLSPSSTARGLGSAVSSPAGSGVCKRILGAFRAQNRVWWQQCDMSHNHSLIINIGSDIDKDCLHCVS